MRAFGLLIFLVGNVAFVECPAQRAFTLPAQSTPIAASKAAKTPDWLETAAQLAPEITKLLVEQGITSISAGLVSEVIIAIGSRIPDEMAKELLLSPRTLFGWSAKIVNRDALDGFTLADPIGLVVGLVVEIMVSSLRDTCPCSDSILSNQYAIETAVWITRQLGVGYSFTRAGIYGAIAAEAVITVVTANEARIEAKKLWDDAQANKESIILTNIMQRVRAASLAVNTENDQQRRADLLYDLDDDLLRGQLRLPKGMTAQVDAWRRSSVARLWKVSALRDANGTRVQATGALYAMQKGEKWGFVDRNGKIRIEFLFDDIGSMNRMSLSGSPLRAEDAYVGSLIAAKLGQKWGFIDRQGKWAIDAQFDDIQACLISNREETFGPYSEDCFAYGPAAVKTNGKWGYISSSGSFVVSPKFDEAQSFHWSGVAVVKVGERYGLINRQGRYLMQPSFDYISTYGSSDVLRVQNGGSLTLQTRFGEKIANMPWIRVDNVDSAGLLSRPINGSTVVELSTGRIVISGGKFDSIGLFKEGLAHFKRAGRSGYIDQTGEVIFEIPYARGNNFQEGLAPVQASEGPPLYGFWGYIDRQGHTVIAPKFKYAAYFSDGMARVLLNGKHGYIDRKGRVAVPIVFDWIGGFHGDRARAVEAGQWVLVDRQGQIVFRLR